MVFYSGVRLFVRGGLLCCTNTYVRARAMRAQICQAKSEHMPTMMPDHIRVQQIKSVL